MWPMSDTAIETDLPPFCADGCGERVTPGLVFGKPRKYIRGHGPQAKGKTASARRPGPTPGLDELKATAEERGEDRTPGSGKKTSGKRASGKKAEPDDNPYRPGVIARGMNRLYARIGRVVRAMDVDMGVAIIETTVKYSDDDVTVGEAWDEYAKANPKVRRVLMKMITGGAVAQLVYAHAPIFLALLMKESISRRIPMANLLQAWFGGGSQAEQPEGDQAGGADFEANGNGNPLAGLFAGMTEADMQQAMSFASAMLPNMGRMPARGTGRTPTLDGDQGEPDVYFDRDGEPYPPEADDQ